MNYHSRWKILLTIFCLACETDNDKHLTWTIYKADPESSCYSALTQINKENVSKLQIAWTFRPDDSEGGAQYGKSECNPIIIDDVMYASSARHRIYAINANTGEKIWSFDPFEGGRGGGVNRGVTYWENGNDKRILFTAGNHLFALDAKKGKPIPSFGENGKVNLNIKEQDNPEAWVVPTSPGIVYRNLLIVGSEVSELYGAAPGHVRAYNIKTGNLEWTFHTIPQPDEAGYETWPKDAWKHVGGANNWGGMSLDEKRGIVFVPLGSPTYDYYGANRKGENLYGNCIVALNANDGKHIWHFQTVHHDLWDYDLPAAPNLVTVKKDGKLIDAIAQPTKTGFLFVLDRETGEPIFPIEERKVPSSNIPGEEVWPTQPFPVKPEPYARYRLSEADLAGNSPDAHDSIVKVFNSLRYEGMYTPPDMKGTLMIPGSRGGSEWGGGAYDPETGLLYLNANESPEIGRIIKVGGEKNSYNLPLYDQGKNLYMTYCSSCHGADRKGQEPMNPSLISLGRRMTKEEAQNKIKLGVGRMPAFGNILHGNEEKIIAYLFEMQRQEARFGNKAETDTTTVYFNLTAYSHFRDKQGNSAIKPPWGTLNAIDLNTGDYAWKIPLGNYPELQQKGAPFTGTENYGGPVVTAGGLLFIGATRDKKFRAFDKTTGALLWETTLSGNGYATPCIYFSGGKQFIAISVSGTKEEPAGSIIAFALSDK